LFKTESTVASVTEMGMGCYFFCIYSLGLFSFCHTDLNLKTDFVSWKTWFSLQNLTIKLLMFVQWILQDFVVRTQSGNYILMLITREIKA